MFSNLTVQRLWAGLWATGLSWVCGMAHADLMLFPTRVVFDKELRAAQVELVNQGSKPETYRISLVNRRMGEAGEFIAVTEAATGEQFADEMIRFSPRQVTIAPGTSQTVRILLRKPAELADGEYRSHLQFDRVADTSGDNSVDQLASGQNPGGVGVVLNALVGASIPVIVRQGQTQAEVSMNELHWQAPQGDQPASVAFALQRRGTRSVYGDVVVSYTAPGQPQAIEVGKATGVAVYTPNATRKARMNLVWPAGVNPSKGTLQVRYRERVEAGGATLAAADLKLP